MLVGCYLDKQVWSEFVNLITCNVHVSNVKQVVCVYVCVCVCVCVCAGGSQPSRKTFNNEVPSKKSTTNFLNRVYFRPKATLSVKFQLVIGDIFHCKLAFV